MEQSASVSYIYASAVKKTTRAEKKADISQKKRNLDSDK